MDQHVLSRSRKEKRDVEHYQFSIVGELNGYTTDHERSEERRSRSARS